MIKVLHLNLLCPAIRSAAYQNPSEFFCMFPSGVKVCYLPGKGYFCYGYTDTDTHFLTKG